MGREKKKQEGKEGDWFGKVGKCESQRSEARKRTKGKDKT